MVTERKPKNVKKLMIFAVSRIAVAIIVLTAILVGVYMFMDSEKNIVKVLVATNIIQHDEIFFLLQLFIKEKYIQNIYHRN